MKKAFHFLVVIILIACSTACTNSTTENSSSSTNESTDNTTADTPRANQPEGLALISKSDCGTCHNATVKVVGPAYTAIAAKYPNTAESISKLADEVIKGSSGIWSAVPMTPHTNLAKPDVEKMVGYILSLGEKK